MVLIGHMNEKERVTPTIVSTVLDCMKLGSVLYLKTAH